MAIIRDDDWIQGDFEWTPDHFFSFQRFVPKVSALAFTSLLLTVFNVLFVSIGAIVTSGEDSVLERLEGSKTNLSGPCKGRCWKSAGKIITR